MNKTFKVVFNRARGALMVVNELTSIVQKKGSKTVIAVAVAAALSSGVAVAEDFSNKTATFANNNALEQAYKSSVSDAIASSGDSFTSNTVTLTQTGGGPTALGIATRGADVTVDGNTFSNNTVTDGETATINGVYGVAIGVTDANLSVKNSKFIANSAKSHAQNQGSAIYQSVGTIEIIGSTFEENIGQAQSGEANTTGGAVSLWGVSGSIEGSQFTKNRAEAQDMAKGIAYGGAVYLRSGIWDAEDSNNDITVKIADTSFSENSARLGGAVYAKSDVDSDKHYLMNLDLDKVNFTRNKATGWGGALFVTGEGSVTMNDITFDGNTAAYGGALVAYANKDNESILDQVSEQVVNATNVNYLNNVASGAGGAAYIYTKANYTQNGGSFVGNRAEGKAVYAGAVMVKGSSATFKDVLFENNVAESTDGVAAGGAILVDKVKNSNVIYPGKVTFEVTKDLTYSGNNVIGTDDVANTYGYWTSTAGGFLFLDRDTEATFNIAKDATLTIGNEDATGNMDSIASAWGEKAEDTNGLITKTGAGSLVINSDLNKYFGKVVVEDGRLQVSKDWAIKDNVAVNGGTLALSTFNFDKAPNNTSEINGSITVGSSGTLETSSSQFFTVGLDENATVTDPEALKYNNGEVTFADGATLALTDAQYNLEYAQNAGDKLTSGKVVMLGTLVGEVDSTVTLDQIESIGGNVALNEVTVDAQDKNIQIGGEAPSDTNTAHRSESLSVGVIDLGTASSVTVTGGKELSLAGNGTDAIASTSEEPINVTVENGSALNLGGQYSKGGQIAGTVTTDADSTVNVTGDAVFTIDSLAGEGTVNVGSDEVAGNLTVNSLADMTGIIFVDPAWKEGTNHIADASYFGYNGKDALAGGLVNGRNSISSFGGSKDEAVSAFEKIASINGLTWGPDGVTSAFYAGSTVDLGTTGGILVDGSLTAAPTSVAHALTINKQGMLIVDQSKVSQPVVKGDVVLNQGSYLGINNASVSSFDLATGTVTDNGTSVVTDNPFIQAQVDGSKVVGSYNAESGLSALASTGIQAMTRRADMMLAQSIADRTSIDQDFGQGANLWVDVSGESYDVDHLDHGGKFDADMGYGAFGADFALTDTVTAGAAIQYGAGSLSSSVSSIKNDIKNYGVALYASKAFGPAKVVGELAYVQSDNDVSSSQAALNQSVDAKIYSAGVRAQYQLTAGAFQFVPSIGVRVSKLKTDAMDIGTVKVDDQDQTLVQMPISLRVNGFEQKADGWTLAPTMRVAYIPTFGDKEIKVYDHEQDVIDTSPVQADFGLRAQKGNLLFNAQMTLGGGKDGASTVGGKVGMKYMF